MSNGTKILIIVAAVLVLLIVLICLLIKKLKKKVKKTMEKVDRCGEYASRIMRIAGKLRNGEAKASLQEIAKDLNLSEVKALFTSDDKLDAILDILETEADADNTDYVKISEVAAGLKDMIKEKRKKGKASR